MQFRIRILEKKTSLSSMRTDFCHDCSKDTMRLPGHRDPQRVCRGCRQRIGELASGQDDYVSVYKDLSTGSTIEKDSITQPTS
eukprot:m.135892 g.135892  ORF g.135892 m.135892 type:complete len:83 (+) comp14718_c0_seq2:1252-1500(+)